MEPQRVLIVGLTSNKGGLETFVLELYRRIDRNRIQFDFLRFSKDRKLAYEDEIVSLGGRVFYCPTIRDNIVEHFHSLHLIFRQTHYKAVYYQANDKILSVDVFRIAMMHAVPIRILHSHNSTHLRELPEGLYHEMIGSGFRDPIYQRIRKTIASKTMNRYVTHYFCCSKAAGEWMFGKNRNFKVINNGIDTVQYAFNPEMRDQIRQLENVKDKVVFGTVARFAPEKNPLFLIDIFHAIHKTRPDSVFWHIGGNFLESQVREKIIRLNLEDSYLLLGSKDNVCEYLNAMDLFLLPSIYEGFPITLVEAQTSGLHCLVSNTITPEVDITGNVAFFSLDEPAEKWADAAISMIGYKRESHQQQVAEQGFDIHTRVRDFEELILSDEV